MKAAKDEARVLQGKQSLGNVDEKDNIENDSSKQAEDDEARMFERPGKAMAVELKQSGKATVAETI